MAARPTMRLFLLPISTRRSLIYCEPLAINTANPSSSSEQAPKLSYLDRAVAKANKTWTDFERDTKAPLNWKRRLTDYGNVLFRRIPFEEWGLKTIPAQPKQPAAEPRAVQVLYPAAYQSLTRQPLAATLYSIAHDRQGLHSSRLRWSIIGMPFTIPFGIIPVIPNIPFFYLCFRAYSHWTALRGARHLAALIDAGSVRAVPSATLDALYTAGLLHPNAEDSKASRVLQPAETTAMVDRIRSEARKQDASKIVEATVSSSDSSSEGGSRPPSGKAEQQRGEEADEVMLLRHWNAKLIAERLGLPGLQVEVERAVEQVEAAIRKTKEARQREQQETRQAHSDGENEKKK